MAKPDGGRPGLGDLADRYRRANDSVRIELAATLAEHTAGLWRDYRDEDLDPERIAEICHLAGMDAWDRLSTAGQRAVRHIAGLEMHLRRLGERIVRQVQALRDQADRGLVDPDRDPVGPLTADITEFEITLWVLGGCLPSKRNRLRANGCSVVTSWKNRPCAPTPSSGIWTRCRAGFSPRMTG